MPLPGFHIETLHNPAWYTRAQLTEACRLASILNRGRLVLVAEPEHYG